MSKAGASVTDPSAASVPPVFADDAPSRSDWAWIMVFVVVGGVIFGLLDAAHRARTVELKCDTVSVVHIESSMSVECTYR